MNKMKAQVQFVTLLLKVLNEAHEVEADSVEFTWVDGCNPSISV